ncbi:MAG: MFS transporter [Candidatus Adiutrix sp.]|jgi:predicted MFS family arabinose efflux permease|nr:MFS transporter [Candidatus Adiutrix sp.]
MTEDTSDAFYRGGVRAYAAPQRLWSLTFLTFVMLNFCIFMGFDILLPTLTLFMEGNGASQAEIGVIFGAFTVSAVLFRMLASRLAWRFEAMHLVRLGLLFCAIVGLYYFWARSTPTAMAARFLHGAGFGLSSTLITALASQIIPPTRMGEGLGYLGLGTTLALALGPFFGIWLMVEWGYLFMFIVVAACYTASILMVGALPKLKLAAPPGAARPRLVLVSRKAMAPSFLMFMVGLIMSAVIIFMALYCKEKGLPYAGHFFVVSTIGIFVARMTSGRVHDRLGHRYVLIPAALTLLGSMLLLAFTNGSPFAFFCASIAYGLSTGAIFPSVQALAFSSTPISARTETTASFFNAFDLGVGSGSLALGYIAGRVGSYGAVYLVAAGLAVFFLAFYLVYYLLVKREA